MAAAQVQLIPIGELAPGELGAIRNQVVRKVLTMVASALSMPDDKLVVRDIRAANDLDYSYEDWNETTGATANAYETMSTGTTGDGRFIAIYGVKDDVGALSCTAIKFNVGGADRAIWQLQALNEDNGCVGISPGVIVIPQNTPYTISRYVRSASSPTHLVLKGFVVEPRGLVVSP